MRRVRGVVPGVILAVLSLSGAALHAQVTFASQTYSLKNEPCQVASGDFNGDGKPDLAVLSGIGGTVSILLNKGDSTFSPAVDFAAVTPQLYQLCSLLVGDFNGDKKLDVIVMDYGDPYSATPEWSIKVLLGNGDGTLGPPIVTNLDSYYPTVLVVGDFNQDGRLDVLRTDSATSLAVWQGNGDGTFTKDTSSSSQVVLGGAFVVGDLNGDGKVDLASAVGDASGTSEMISALLGNGGGTFKSAPQSSDPLWTGWLAAGDFNHDGVIDLVSASIQVESCEFLTCRMEGPPGGLSVLIGNGDGTFGGPGVISSGNYGPVATGDFDGDGNDDIVAFGTGFQKEPPAPSLIMLGDGTGNFPTQSALSLSSSFLIAADLNADGLSDIALVNCCQNLSVQVEINTTPGFSLSASTEGGTVSAGASATYTINIGQQNGFSGSVALTCLAPASQGITCALSPASVNPGSSSTLTVSTTGMSSSAVRSSSLRWAYALWMPLAAVFLGALPKLKSQNNEFSKLLFVGIVCAVVWIQLGCAGGSSNAHNTGTAAGKYTITITGKSGSLQRTTTASLTVQ